MSPHRGAITSAERPQRLRDAEAKILALEIADRAYVLASGALRLSGTSKQLLASSDVDRAYLGIGAS